MSRLRLLGFTVTLALLIWVTSRVGVALHESSHLLVGGLFGADLAGLHVPLFGDGYGNFSFAEDTGATPRFLALIVGPVSHILSGLTAMFLSRIPFRSRWVRLALITYGAVNLLAGLQYLGSGLHYGYGDPADSLIAYLPPCMPNPVNAGTVTTISVVVVTSAIGVASYFLTRDYLVVQELWFPAGSPRARTRILLMTAVPAVIVFVGAFMLSGGDSPTFYAGGDSRWNVPARDLQIADGVKADQRAHPDRAVSDSCRRAANDYVNVYIGDREAEQREAVDKLRSRGVPPDAAGKLPLLPVSGALLGLGASLALTRSGRAREKHEKVETHAS
ncbi:hypothetical protein AB0912_33835 [Streptomyces sp. NPDC007084]|uniref:hypothetical protein n=1 Tax=Streptomyces sp. NPDC007084 TaxID=3154313 RepID=UPI0034567755